MYFFLRANIRLNPCNLLDVVLEYKYGFNEEFVSIYRAETKVRNASRKLCKNLYFYDSKMIVLESGELAGVQSVTIEEARNFISQLYKAVWDTDKFAKYIIMYDIEEPEEIKYEKPNNEEEHNNFWRQIQMRMKKSVY